MPFGEECLLTHIKNMEHPFVGDLSSKTLEELTDTVSELNKKMIYAGRMNNFNMINQLRMIIESYNNVIHNKQQELWANKSSLDISKKIKID